jgi:putative nucleotidyltransferase with HDIG domain
MVAQPSVFWAGLLVAVYVAVAAWVTFEVHGEPAYRSGQVVDQAVVSRVAFKAVDVDATSRAREAARVEVPAIYVPSTTLFEAMDRALQTLPAVAAAAPSLDMVAAEIRSTFGLTEATFEELRRFNEGERPSAQWQKAVNSFIASLQHRPIITTERYQIEMLKSTLRITLRYPGGGLSQVAKTNLVNIADESQVRRVVEELAASFTPTIRPLIVNAVVAGKAPTFQFDQTATEAARAAAAEAVQPSVATYEPSQVIVPAGVVVDESNYYRLMEREERAYEASMTPMQWTAHRLGPVVGIALGAMAIAVGVGAIRPRVGRNPMRGLALTLLLSVTVLLAYVIRPLGPQADPVSLIAPAILAAVILTIAYDALFASVVVALHAVVVGIALELSVPVLLTTIAGVVLSSMQVREIRQRGTLIQAGFITGIVMFVGVLASEFSQRQLIEGIHRQIFGAAALAGFGTLGVGFFVLGILPTVEKIFRVTTSMTLLELCDVNTPLLRRLAQSAPGTYNHSLVIGTLAENAAQAIGANGLLARVGAYYHDVGKINKPQYFVENRVGGINLHEKLSPAMSLLIIVGHVKDGIELAREYGLPPILYHFIESHHGTTLVEYFYHEACKGKSDEEHPEEFEYRYPGPKPHTREAAILMICDAVESASRAMAEPTATRIEQLVHRITMKRLMDGQFDHCDITLGELEQIEQSLTRSLAGIYHGRVAYPSAARDSKPTTGGDKGDKTPERAVG